MAVRRTTPVLAAMVLGLVAAGCAPRPDQIAASPVVPQLYAGLSCPQLVSSQTALNRKLAFLTAEQSQAATDDAVGVLLLFRPLASLSGGNLQDRVALAKGEVEQVNMRLARDCQG